MKEIFYQEYTYESLIDLEEDISTCLNQSNVPKDENGFLNGTFRVIIKWSDDEN